MSGMFKRKKAEEAPGVILPITPMLDMSFQLLTFFIFTYNPSALEGQEEIALPSATVGQAHKHDQFDPRSNPNRDPKKNPEKVVEINVLLQYTGTVKQEKQYDLTLDTDGVTLPFKRGRNYSENKAHLLADLKERYKKHEAAIRDKHAEAEDRDKKIDADLNALSVRVVPSSEANWGEVVDVRDLCRLAGFRKVVCAEPLSKAK